ncbi:hypothetical protein ACFLVB_01270 [Chloroflexota bacterium]
MLTGKMKKYLLFILAVFVITSLMLTSCRDQVEVSSNSQPKAAIVDQLYLLEPNPAFIEQASRTLESYGFTVDVWQGEEITVDFYRELPSYGYKLIIFRIHSGLLLTPVGSKVTASELTYLFTGEKYTTTKYVTEQLTERVSNALMSDDYPEIFAVNSEFISQELQGGGFTDAVILMMGCETYFFDDMAEAFVRQGASVYLGWSTWVSLEYVDKATLNLLDNLSAGNLTIERGIAEMMSEVGTDPYFEAYMKYYPAESGGQTIGELVK